MTLFRTIVVMVGGLLLMLTVVILRAETTRLHYEVSQCERRADECRQRLREGELELARLRNPMVIRQKVKDTVDEFVGQKAEKPEKPAKPVKDAPKKRSRP
jgi:hypothetical protein